MKDMHINQELKQVVIVERNESHDPYIVEVRAFDESAIKTTGIDSVRFDDHNIDLSAIDDPIHPAKLPMHFTQEELWKAICCFGADEHIQVDMAISNETHTRYYIFKSAKRTVYVS